MIDIIDGFKPCGKQKKKNQIILTHSSRSVGDYLQSLKLRFNGKFKRIPNYIVTRDGQILQLLGNNEHSNYFTSENINKNSIIVCLENLGWLEKEPLSNHYVNWIGDIYKGNVFEKKWRDYFFWEPYTEKQIDSTVILCKMLFNELGIKDNVIGHNTRINGIEKFEGVVTKSNFDSNFTDVSPAFNFEKFLKKIENEQLT
jgi:N-acetyl-anhydromuramyl-L-alanine amidase AmpD